MSKTKSHQMLNGTTTSPHTGRGKASTLTLVQYLVHITHHRLGLPPSLGIRRPAAQHHLKPTQHTLIAICYKIHMGRCVYYALQVKKKCAGN